MQVTKGVIHYEIPGHWVTSPVMTESFPVALEFCKSMGVDDLTDKYSVRRAWLASEKEDAVRFSLWLYLDVCSDKFGIDYFSPGHAHGWEYGVGAFLKEKD
jgi:hypothetical protein